MLIRAVTWLFRAGVGATFIFSGFVKAIDPWGTFYKFQDYSGAFGMNVPDNVLLTAVFLLCIYEFVIGVFIAAGCFRRSAPIGTAALMVIMLPLTLWIAIKDPVADCGCFGEALVISNWATFWKNVVLCATIAWLIKYNRSCRCLIRPYIQWIAFTFSAIFILLIGLAGYIYQPLLDFRPFPIGTDIAEAATDKVDPNEEPGEGASEDEEDEDSEDNMIFIYADSNGVEKSFTLDDELPEESDGWRFVRRESKSSDENQGFNAAASSEKSDSEGLHVWSEDGNDEVTADVIRSKGKQILLLMPDIGKVSIASTWQINMLQTMAEEQGADMIAIVAGSNEEIERWKDLSLAAYPVFKAEDTQIKMLVRGNPALVYLKDGKIVWKSTLRALDTEALDDERGLGGNASFETMARDNRRILTDITGIYVLLMLLLIFLSFLPSLGRFFPSKMQTKIAKRDDKLKEAEERQLKKAEEKLRVRH